MNSQKMYLGLSTLITVIVVLLIVLK